MALDEDIARVAAMRGQNTAEALAKAARLAQPDLKRDMVALILKPSPDERQDIRWFDMLPPASRAFIRECETPLSSTWWAWNLHESGYQEDELIKAVQYLLNTTGDRR
jgi:hypothetical protein